MRSWELSRLITDFDMWIITLVLFQILALAISASPTVYLIRHGEKPVDGGNGLNAQGEQRAQCLRKVFGPDSGFNIGKIIAQKPKKSQYLPDVVEVRDK